MKVEIGTYLIIKKASWTKLNEQSLIILSFDEEDVYYRYVNEKTVRQRSMFNFCDVELVPLTTLTEELL